MDRVSSEIKRAFAEEKAVRKITQQAVADTIGTSRAVVNRQVQGHENLSARRIAELLWAVGWEPHFEARRIPDEANDRLEAGVSAWPCPTRKTGTTSGESASIRVLSDDGLLINAA